MRTRLGKCKGFREGEVMEAAVATATAGRKRKIRLGGLQSDSDTSPFQLKTRRIDVEAPENSASPTNFGNSSCESVGSEHVEASCCSSYGSSGLAKRSLKFVDLEEAEMIPEFSPTSAGEYLLDRKRRETMPSSEVQPESGELKSTVGPCESKSYCHRMEKLIPSEAELEEFFSVAETNLEKQFIDKYNYDIVEDQPLEGRYEWVQIFK